MTMTARPKLTEAQRHERAEQIFATVLDGRSYAEIAESEGLGVRRIQQIVRETLTERRGDPLAAYKHIQFARIEAALRLIEREIAAGKLSAVPHLIPMLAAHASGGLGVGEIVRSDDPRIGRFAAALDQLDISREIVSARLSRGAAREKLQRVGESPPQVIEIPQNGEMSDFAAPKESTT
jgi:hypothetical protein